MGNLDKLISFETKAGPVTEPDETYEPQSHAALGASSSHRWMKCPGSIRLSEQAPRSEGTTSYMAEGTAAHMVAEICLEGDLDANSQVGRTYEVDEHLIEITQEMTDAVQLYLDYCRILPGEGTVEQSFDLTPLGAPAPMYGIADYACWDPESRTLEVVDLKFGKGVVVEIDGNSQLQFYALGATLEIGKKPDRIVTTVVQPRAEHPDGPIRTWSFGWDRLVAFKKDLMAAAEEASQPDAPVGPTGDHCRFCPAKAICPAQQEQALDVVQQEFATVSEETLPAPTELTQEEILAVLNVAGDVEDWLNAIRSYVKGALEQGVEVPGWKLVPKRAYRRWANEDEARAWMEEHGIDPDRRKTRSPNQAEKAAKSLEDVEVPEDLWAKRSSGTNLVPESNPREAVTPATEAQQIFGTEEEDE